MAASNPCWPSIAARCRPAPTPSAPRRQQLLPRSGALREPAAHPPSPSPLPKEIAMDEHLSLDPAVVLTPRRAGLRAGQDNVVDVLLRVQAPDTPTGHAAAR